MREKIREAPAPSPLGSHKGSCHPARPDEPILAIDQTQGNILAGFNKDFQTLLFLKTRDGQAADFKRWLNALTPYIATTAEVLAFNRLFKAIRKRRGSESRTVQSTWINIALSFHPIQSLVP